jgi:hypothetical protein
VAIKEKMKNVLIISLLTISMNSFAQKMEIITRDEEKIEITILDSEKTKEVINEFNGIKNEPLRKKWTSRTYLLSNNKVLVEFYDGQSILAENQSEFKKLKEVRFVKNNLWNFKKNVSYKIEIPFEKGKQLAKSNNVRRLNKYKSDLPEVYDFEVYELGTEQILFIDLSANSKSATIYKDIKTLASENSNIEEIEYGFEDDEHYMKELANGNPLDDFEPNEHLIYPKYVEDIVKNHNLSLKETKVYVNDFWGNLYESQKGYWVLIDEINQSNGAGSKMSIPTIRIFENLEQVRKAQANYERFKEEGVTSEHFYQKVSDKYGQNFPNHIDSLINELPRVLNFDEEQLSISKNGLSIINEAIKWNHNDWKLFESWFPSVLAYYGEYYMQSHEIGKWESKIDKEYNVWIPQITLENEISAFDMRDFYKDLYESPIPIEWAGDFDGKRKEMRRKIKNNH